MEFAEGGKTSPLPLGDALKALLAAQPKIVEFGERGAARTGNVNLDDPAAIAAKAVEFQETELRAGRTINTAEAVRHITARI